MLDGNSMSEGIVICAQKMKWYRDSTTLSRSSKTRAPHPIPFFRVPCPSLAAPHLLSIDLLPLIVLHDAPLFHALLNLLRHALRIHIIRNEHVIRVRPASAGMVAVRQYGIRDGVRVDHRRSEHAARA